MARPAGQAFSWSQFTVMLRVIRKGEQRTDETGMGLGETSVRLRGLPARVGRGLRVAAVILLCLMLAAMFFMLGVALSAMGASPYVAFSLSVIGIVMMTVLVGLYQAVNVLYFVRDISYYLALPVSSTSIMWAKLVHFLGSALIGDLVFAPITLGVLWDQGGSPLTWVASLIGFVLCAVAVNLALVIVCVPVMRFSRLAHDKDRFSRVFGAAILVIALVVGAGSQFVMRGDGLMGLADGVERLLAMGPAAVALALLCPPTLASRMVVAGTGPEVVLGLVAMVALVALYVALLSVVARRWYFDGVQALQGAGSKRGRRVEGAGLARATAARGQVVANLSRDWKTMVRVPVFFNQFFLSALLMPLYFLVIAAVAAVSVSSEMGEAGVSLDLLLGMVREAAGSLSVSSAELSWCAVGVLAFSVLLGFSSYIFTLAVSRDGEDFFFMRGMPMDWRAYLVAKFIAPFALSMVPMLAIIVAALLVAGVPVLEGACLVAVYVGSMVSLSLLSLGLGTCFPNLSWENEAQLVKGGGATVMVLAGVVADVVVVALPVVALLAGAYWQVVSPMTGLALALGVFVAECAGLAWWVLGPCARRLSRLGR